jgi:hypothetical protein
MPHYNPPSHSPCRAPDSPASETLRPDTLLLYGIDFYLMEEMGVKRTERPSRWQARR